MAQPVIDGQNYTGPSTVLTYEVASPAWLADFDTEGENGDDITWDFTDFTSVLQQVDTYMPIGSSSFIHQFYFNNSITYPDNLATHTISLGVNDVGTQLPIAVTDLMAFYRRNDSGYYTVGTAFSIEGLPLATLYEDTDRILKFPLEYGDQDSSAIQFLTQIPFLGAYGQSGTRWNYADSWGTLNTPYGTYDALRVVSELDLTDTIYIDQTGTGQSIQRPIQLNYLWISPEVSGPVLEATVIEGQVVSARMLSGTSLVAVNNPEDVSTLIYPNPVRYTFQLKGIATPANLDIYSSEGKWIKSVSLTGKTDRVDVEELPAGLYLINIVSGVDQFTARIVVEK